MCKAAEEYLWRVGTGLPYDKVPTAPNKRGKVAKTQTKPICARFSSVRTEACSTARYAIQRITNICRDLRARLRTSTDRPDKINSDDIAQKHWDEIRMNACHYVSSEMNKNITDTKEPTDALVNSILEQTVEGARRDAATKRRDRALANSYKIDDTTIEADKALYAALKRDERAPTCSVYDPETEKLTSRVARIFDNGQRMESDLQQKGQ